MQVSLFEQSALCDCVTVRYVPCSHLPVQFEFRKLVRVLAAVCVCVCDRLGGGVHCEMTTQFSTNN